MDLKDTTLSPENLVSSLEPSITNSSSRHSSHRVYSLQQMHVILEKLNLFPVIHNYQKNKALNIANACIDMERNESIACQYVSKMVLNTRPSNKDFQKNFDKLELTVSYAKTLIGKIDSSVDMIIRNAENLNEALATTKLVTTELSSEIPLEENEDVQQFYDTSAIKASLDKCYALNNERNNLQQELKLLEETLKPLQILPSNLNEIKSKMDEANKTIDDLKSHLYKQQH